MEQALAERLAEELKIDVTQVVREFWEVLFLKVLLESPHGKNLVFKGGTALRLAYGSPTSRCCGIRCGGRCNNWPRAWLSPIPRPPSPMPPRNAGRTSGR